jgi:1,2-diacylglycerol 3-beta-galactosyltransferase
MDHPQIEKPRIVFLFSDTGGGHRSGAEAIIEAINLEFPNRFTTEMVDIFREYAPRPLNLAPQIYPTLSRMPEFWKFGYHVSDGRRRTRFFYSVVYPYIRRSLHRLLDENPCDLIVSVHQVTNTPVLRAMRNNSIPFATVVLDMVSTHAAWYDPRADLVIVPTEAARLRALKNGLCPERVKVVGMPVANRFCQPLGDQAELRKKLGWPENLPMILMVGGGEGMGPLENTALAIEAINRKVGLAVICGRNRKLKNKLESHPWQIPAYIYGFVNEMPDFMRAADILVTKAGPGTISEAFIAGLPMILYSRMPGQEDGNVTYVSGEGAGLWAPNPTDAAAVVSRWIDYPLERKYFASRSLKLARPNAAREIACALVEQVGKKAFVPVLP